MGCVEAVRVKKCVGKISKINKADEIWILCSKAQSESQNQKHHVPDNAYLIYDIQCLNLEIIAAVIFPVRSFGLNSVSNAIS